MEKYDRAGQVTDDKVIRHFSFTRCVSEASDTHT
jgi:hypothetical protein